MTNQEGEEIMEKKAYYKSPIGWIKIVGSEQGIKEVEFARKAKSDPSLFPCIKECLKQLDDYFNNKRVNFDLPLVIEGTDFQRSVWKALTKIPYGKTLSYADIATRIKNPKASRAVGNANNKNKLAIVVPCHRVIGRDGSLTGYASGVNKKDWLLKHESK